MGEKVPTIMLALQRSNQYLKKVIKSVKLEATNDTWIVLCFETNFGIGGGVPLPMLVS
jgi:hypothetical protein